MLQLSGLIRLQHTVLQNDLYMSQLTDGICLGYANGGTITKVYSWFTFVINAIIPLTSLIYMNGVIIQKVRSSHKQF